MTTRHKLIVLAASSLALAAPGDRAAAQVFVDPGSPSGKEYAIPLEEARREAASGGSDLKVAPGSRSAPLFGEGVGDGASDGGGSGSDDGSGGAAKSDGGAQRSGSSGASGTSGGKVAQALESTHTVGAAVPQGGLGSTATIGAVALSVLLLGAVLGSIARRRTH
jgi:hypothetical protein